MILKAHTRGDFKTFLSHIGKADKTDPVLSQKREGKLTFSLIMIQDAYTHRWKKGKTRSDHFKEGVLDDNELR